MTPFNIGQRIELTDFTEKEARRLADGLECESDVSAALIARVLHWTGGHPYLTQRLSQELARDPSVTDASDVDRLCAGLFFSERAQEQDSGLEGFGRLGIDQLSTPMRARAWARLSSAVSRPAS